MKLRISVLSYHNIIFSLQVIIRYFTVSSKNRCDRQMYSVGYGRLGVRIIAATGLSRLTGSDSFIAKRSALV